MRSKKEIMHKKLALQIMNKSSISNEKWAELTETEIMKLTQFPLQVREMLVNYENSKNITLAKDNKGNYTQLRLPF